jgi:hypothetical protein
MRPTESNRTQFGDTIGLSWSREHSRFSTMPGATSVSCRAGRENQSWGQHVSTDQTEAIEAASVDSLSGGKIIGVPAVGEMLVAVATAATQGRTIARELTGLGVELCRITVGSSRITGSDDVNVIGFCAGGIIATARCPAR